MIFHDRALIDGPARITREGHFVARARVARANNVQDYFPRELGLPPKADGTPYRIFRPEAEVFAKDSLASALHKTVVIDHPAEDVNATNWKALSVGDTGGDILRDGEFMSVPVMVMDAKGVNAIQSTHREFSWGYSGEIELTPGKFGDSEYDGSVKNIRYNHLAMCGSARGGSDLRVTDALVIIDERPSPPEKPTMKITIGDAKDVDLSDGAAVALAVGALNTTLTDAQTKVGTLTADNATLKDANEKLTGENVALKQQVADAAITPEKLQTLADARAKVIGDAKKLGGETLVTDGKTDAEIRKAAVSAKLGDASKDMSDAAIEGAFAALIAAAPATRAIVPNGSPVNLGDAEADYDKAHEARKAALRDGWNTPFNSAAAA